MRIKKKDGGMDTNEERRGRERRNELYLQTLTYK